MNENDFKQPSIEDREEYILYDHTMRYQSRK